jgi:malonyl CoA-acyl carrier protein transacylase/phosphopantetheinyl transferase
MSIQPALVREYHTRHPVLANGRDANKVREPRPSDRWETEVVILHAEDRVHLRQRAVQLADFLQGHREVPLKDLAFTLNSELPAGGSRLAVVASSVEELGPRLTTAADRLADPKCRQIRDSQGVYFFEKPLHLEGRLAVLFPGEGSQFVNMLSDVLPHFPEVKAHFAFVDRLLIQTGSRTTPLSDIILLRPDATPEEQAAAEKEMWRLATGCCSVLCAEWSLYQILLRLGLKPDVAAGHSSGELSALAAAGCVTATEENFALMFNVSQGLQQQEDSANLAEAILLAVGAGRKTVTEIIEQTGAAVFIAMDNCPHQTVLAGPPEAVIAVEAQLRSRGVVCERMPFHRPYHTPLFEPLLGPAAHIYHQVGMNLPSMPVYSCVTGQPLPHDAQEIERLAIKQWAAAVQFTRMVENMYADGVRVFLEAGPRGTLTSFVEDILRGRSFAAIASNLQRRSGLTQLNHMAGLLLAHHVPIRLNHFYSRRNPQRVEWESGNRGDRDVREPEKVTADAAPSAAAEHPLLGRGLATIPQQGTIEHPHTEPGTLSERGRIVSQHWTVMEQFLDLQREVMEQFLATRVGRISNPSYERGQANWGSEPPPDGRAGDDNGRAGDMRPPVTRQEAEVTGSSVDPPRSPAVWPLLGEVICHEPGRELLLRRRMDLREDLYALDHTLGGRDVSAIDRDLHGLPVMPMAFSIEMMAEAASSLVPGKVLVGMRRVRLQRWIPFDEQEPITLELNAKVTSADPIEVAITIRDLGSNLRPGNAESPVVEGTVLLGDQYAEPPAIDDFPLTNQTACRYTAAQLYDEERRMFHGPIFQAVCATDRNGDEGIEGHLLTLSHATLFRSTNRPDLLTDPLLIDASTHLLGCWHLSVPDQTGRVVFPYELGTVQFYGPRPAEGTQVKCRVAIGETSSRRVSHRIDLIRPDGRLWCRVEPAEYWRFYVAQRFVDFYRRHSEFSVTEEWPVWGRTDLKSVPQPRDISCRRVQPAPDNLQPVWRNAFAHVALSPAEWAEFRDLKWPEQRKNDWLFGRGAAKDAVRRLWAERYGDRLFPADMEIDADPHGRPVVRLRGPARWQELPNISITHSGGVMAALAAFGRPVGIDLERIQHRKESFEEIAFDEEERRLLGQFSSHRDEAITRFWCAKEAVAKALGRGLAEGPRSLGVRAADPQTGAVQLALGPLLADAYPELRMDLLVAHTIREGEWIVATTFCERAGT